MAFQDLAKQRAELPQLGLAERLERVRRNKEFISVRSRGEKVKWLQEELNRFYRASGRESEVVAVTGVFDRATSAAVKTFQKLNGLDDQGNLVAGGGLKVDGIVGPRTMRALDLVAGRNTLPAEEYFALVKKNAHTKSQKVAVAAKAVSQAEVPALVKTAEPAQLATLRTDLKLPLPPAVPAAQVKPEKLQAVLNELCKSKECPLPAETILSLCQEKGFDLSLFLSQALIESHLGTVGHRPLETKNIFNVGNVDSGANRAMASWEDGAKKYLELMCKAYGTTAEDVINADFQRTDGGGRYATDPHYTNKIAARVAYFRQKLS